MKILPKLKERLLLPAPSSKLKSGQNIQKENEEGNDSWKRLPSSVHRSIINLKYLIYSNAWMFKKPSGKKIPPFFLTLTYEENIIDLKESNRIFTKFIQRFNYELFNTKKIKLAYVAVPEFQKRGAVHYHCVLFNMPFMKNKVYKTIRDIWGYGKFVNLKRVRTPWGLYRYLSKYVSKNFMDNRLKGKKKYFAGKNVLRPLIIRDFEAVGYLSRSIPKEYIFKRNTGFYPTPYCGNILFDRILLKFPCTIFDFPIDSYITKNIESK